MAKTGFSDRIRRTIIEDYIEPARRRGETTVRVRAGDLVKKLQVSDRTPQICLAMKSKKLRDQAKVEMTSSEGPPSGQSTTTTVTYKLPSNHAPTPDLFDSMYGMLRDSFAAVGGSEKWFQQERAAFYGPDDPRGRTE